MLLTLLTAGFLLSGPVATTTVGESSEQLQAPATLEPAAASSNSEQDPLETQHLIDSGLEFLVANQQADGSFGGLKTRPIRLGVTALATLSLMADSNVEYRGRYHEAVSHAIRFLTQCSTRNGERRGYIVAPGDTTSKMHGHGYATLALTQAFGMFGNRRRFSNSSDMLKQVIQEAVSIIVRSQSRAGGWNYDPFDLENDEGSITVCMLQALRGARNTGFHVPRETIDRAVEYLRQSQNEDGSFRYQLFGDSESSFELTAAATSSLLNAGEYEHRSIRRARDYLWGMKLDSFLSSAPRGYPFYGLLHAACVLRFDYDRDLSSRTMPRIEAWFRRQMDMKTGSLIRGQSPEFREGSYGPVYYAALATLTLQVHDRALPIFDR